MLSPSAGGREAGGREAGRREAGWREGGRQAVGVRGGVVFCLDFFAPWRKLFFYPSPPYSFLNCF